MELQQPRGVLVAHPGTQHSYETALAVQQAGLLQGYLTGVYFKPESALARVIRSFPSGIGAKLERELRRRYHAELAPQQIRTFPLAELFYLTSSRIGPLRVFSESVLRWRNERFDRLIAQIIPKERPAAVVCYDSCALRTFQKAKSLGILCVLDQTSGHIKTYLRLDREEAELHPEFADSLRLELPDGWVERCCKELELAHAVFISSAYGKQTLLENGVLESKIFVVPYAAEISRFQPRVHREGEPFRILFIGQIGQRKGVKYLLEAFKQLALPGAELLLVGGIVGSGAGLQPYRKYFTHVPHVPRAEVHKYFQSGSIFVIPSLHESGVLAIHEALASGLPVIATPNCGSVVRDGVEGFLVPIRDIAALKEKILLLYERPELREAMGRQARKRAEEFTWANYRQQLSRLLLQLLEANGYTRS